MMRKIYPVILCGGSGTRLWPLSREAFPKQLISLVSERSMLQDTLCRFHGKEGFAEPVVICNYEHRFVVAEQMRNIQVSPRAIILEPAGRNTAPAAAVAALTLRKHDPDAIMLLLPADHLVDDAEAFLSAVTEGMGVVDRGFLVTIGIIPEAPETGYGYLKVGEPLSARSHRVSRFVEKPNRETAEAFLDDGRYLWNSGIFLFSCRQFLDELKKYRADIHDACVSAHDELSADLDFHRLSPQSFMACPSESIDYAVMELTTEAAVVSAEMGWNDIGAWPALWAVGEKDGAGNVTRGDILLSNVERSYIRAESRMVAAVGVQDLVIVETPDAVLVTKMDTAQNVKSIVGQLKQSGRSEHEFHARVARPWGWYEGIDKGDRFQVKRIAVKPGGALSLQMHHHRAEHWIVVKGTAKVTRDAESFLVSENQSTFIPLGTRHRLENPGKVMLEMIEVQSGSYLGEDDIIRFEDVYGR